MTRVELAKLLENLVVDPAFQPEGKITKCNFALQRVAFEYGYSDFNGKMANDIYKAIKANKQDWQLVDADGAATAAWNGMFVVAAQPGKAHGHVATIYPGGLSYSGTWGRNCPIVANVGVKNAIMKASMAFKEEPEYFMHTRVG